VKTLAIDIETYSSEDLTKSGVYKYVQADDFEILLLAYRVDNEPVQVIDIIGGEIIPDKVIHAFTDPGVIKTAHNANFEKTCMSRFFEIKLPVEQWQCTMVKASMLGLPLSLDAASKALQLSEGKSAAGKALIKYFCVPCKPTKVNGGRLRNLPEHAPEKWAEFKAYCAQDVVVESAIRDKISFFTIPAKEQQLWELDQTINDNGILLDPSFVNNAIRMDLTYREKLTSEAVRLTGLDNPNSATQLKAWLTEETDVQVDSLTKTAIPELLKNIESDKVKRVLTLRQEMSKTSVKKYTAMVKAICPDLRVRGLLQFYGANRTGRWAGRLVQVQNLPRNELKDLDLARELVKEGDLDMMEMLFGNVPDTLSQLIRTAFVPSPGHRFIVADFSAIEARVIAWLAGEKWRLDVFNTHGKIYEASAAHMFKVPLETVTKGSPLRQRGKVAELALGYGGGPNALIAMGALRNGVNEEELPKLVAMWRQANRAIVNYWDRVEDAAIKAVNGEPSTLKHDVRFFKDKGILFINLPSGRLLSYLKPQIRAGKFGGESLYYQGMDQTTKQWGIQNTYGGKLVENIVQAIARDCLADAMIRVRDAGYNIVMHIHDELVLEVPDGKGSVEEVNKIMGQEISWAKSLPMAADSFETRYYKKD
jgi:DNA polymerase bacteriophage-type